MKGMIVHVCVCVHIEIVMFHGDRPKFFIILHVEFHQGLY